MISLSSSIERLQFLTDFFRSELSTCLLNRRTIEKNSIFVQPFYFCIQIVHKTLYIQKKVHFVTEGSNKKLAKYIATFL